MVRQLFCFIGKILLFYGKNLIVLMHKSKMEKGLSLWNNKHFVHKYTLFTHLGKSVRLMNFICKLISG